MRNCRRSGVAYVCFEQAQALCARDKKLDDSEYRADASDPGTSVQGIILDGHPQDDMFQQWVARLGIGHILQRGLRFISTGEMRKTLLIKAILSEPALLILDSPLDGLDHATQLEMRQVIDELLHSAITVVMLCRRMEDIPEAVSHVMVLNEGQVLACGSRGEMLDLPAVNTLMNPPLEPLAQLPPPAPRDYQLPDTAHCWSCTMSACVTVICRCCARCTGCSSATLTVMSQGPTAVARAPCSA